MSDDVLTFEELRRAQSKERDSDTLQELEEEFFDRARRYLKIKKNPGEPLQNQEYRNAKNILQDVLDMRQKKIVKLAFLSVKSGVEVENLLPGEEELFEDMKGSIEDYREDLNEDVFEDLEKGVVETGDEEEGATEEIEERDTVSSEEMEEQVDPEDDEEEELGEEDETGSETEVEEEEQEEELEVADVEEEEDSEVEEDDIDDEDSGGGASDILEFDTEDEEEDEEEHEEVEGTEGKEEEDNGSGDDVVSIEAQEDIPEFMGTDLQPYGPFEEGEEVEVPEENAEVLEDQGKGERVS